ncbi:MAG TPA: GlsB/YeaQ/YmgE family stress response membrane protein [Actinomycetota bacterium]
MIAHITTLAVLAQDAGGRGDDIDIASILGYVVVGAIVGVLARVLVPGREDMGVIATIVLGIIGAVIGGWVAGAIFEDTAGVDWIASIVAAIGLVLLARAVRTRA